MTGRTTASKFTTEKDVNYVTEPEMDAITLTVEEAAQVLGIGRNSAYEGIRAGEIPSVRIGRRILVPRCALDRLLENAGSQVGGDSDGAEAA